MKQVRLKDVCIFNPPSRKYTNDSLGTFLPMESIGTGFVNSSHIKKFSELSTGGYTPFQRGDVIRAIVTPCFENLKGALIDTIDTEFGFGTTELLCLRAKKISNKYLYYYSISYDFYVAGINSMKGTGGLKRINNKLIANLIIPINNIDFQTAIANYLDYHTAKIDSEISYLEKKSSLLEEYKQSLIFETVTKGLDKSVPMKDSGIDWIGEIPEHWEVKRVKDISRISTGQTPERKKTENFTNIPDLGTLWIKPEDLNNRFISSSREYISEIGLKQIKAFHPQSIIFSGIGDVGKIGISIQKFTTNQQNHILHTLKVYYVYLYYQLIAFKQVALNLSTGNVVPILNSSRLGNLFCLSNTLNEEKEIADFLDTETAKIDKKVELFKKKIELLKEYKQSLIYEAVTGKIEIPQEFYSK